MSTRTARETITDAFHRMTLISEDEAPTAEQINRGLSVMNDMMNGFEAEGIQYVHTDLTLDTTINVPDSLVRSVMWMLLDDLADEYGKALTPRQAAQVARARNNLQSFYTPVPVGQIDEGVLNRAYARGTIRTL